MAAESTLDGARGILATIRAGRSALLALAAAHLPYERLVELHLAADPEGDLLDDVHAAIDRRVRAMRARAYVGADALQPSVAGTPEPTDDEPTPRDAATVDADPIRPPRARAEAAPGLPEAAPRAPARAPSHSRLARTLEKAEQSRALQERVGPIPEALHEPAAAAPPPRPAASLAALGKAAAAAMADTVEDEATPIGADVIEPADEELAEIRAAAVRVSPVATVPAPSPVEDLREHLRADEDDDGEDAADGVRVAPARIDLAAPKAAAEPARSVADADSQAMEEEDEDASAGTGKAVAGGLRVGPSRGDRAQSRAPRLTEEPDEPATGLTAEPVPLVLPAADEGRVAAVHLEAKTYFDRGELGKAVQAFTDLVELKHDMADAFLGRGRCHLELGDYSSAMSDFQRAEDLRPDRPDSHVAMGDLFFARKEYRRAIEHYDEAVELDGSHAMARCRRGISHYYRKNYRQAFQDLQRAYSLDPEIPNIRKYIQMAVKKMERGD